MTTREIVLDGGSPWGFRMHGGADVGQPLRISRVNPGSKAAQKGIREGDVISSINGQPTRGVTNSDAHSLLRNAGQTVHLGLNEECGGSPKRRSHRSSQQQQEVTRHSSQQSLSKLSDNVNGTVTSRGDCRVSYRRRGHLSKQHGRKKRRDCVANILRSLRSLQWRPHLVLRRRLAGKDDSGVDGVFTPETKGRRRQKERRQQQLPQPAPLSSLTPPQPPPHEESPGSSAVSSDVKEEPATAKSKKRKRNRRKSRSQQKNAATLAEGNAHQSSVVEQSPVVTSNSADVEEKAVVSSNGAEVEACSSDATSFSAAKASEPQSPNLVNHNSIILVVSEAEISTESANYQDSCLAIREKNTADESDRCGEWKELKAVDVQEGNDCQNSLITGDEENDVNENLGCSENNSALDLDSNNCVPEINATGVAGELCSTNLHPVQNSETTGEFKVSEENSISPKTVTEPEEQKETVSELVASVETSVRVSEKNLKPKSAVQVTSYQSSVECRAILIETVDEEVWEEAVEFSVEGVHDPEVESCPLTSNTVTLHQYELTEEDKELLDSRPLIAAEEEETLRNFLYSLNLADYGKDGPRRGKRRSSLDAVCNPGHQHQRGLEVIMEENSSEISDSGGAGGNNATKHGKGWKDAVFIPETNQVVYLNDDADSADEGEYKTLETPGKTRNDVRSVYCAEATTSLPSEGTSSSEMREFIYRTVGGGVKDEEDVFSANMERMLEADTDTAVQIVEVSEGEDVEETHESQEDIVTTQKTEEKQSGVEIVFVEDETTSTSSGAAANMEDVDDTPYEDVIFPIQEQKRKNGDYCHNREDNIYENVEVINCIGHRTETLDVVENDSVYENIDFTKRDAIGYTTFSTSSSQPNISHRHLNSLVPLEQLTQDIASKEGDDVSNVTCCSPKGVQSEPQSSKEPKNELDAKPSSTVDSYVNDAEDGRESVTPTNSRSRRESSSSDDTASHGTAFYCPVGTHSPALSSDADISSMTEDVPDARRKKTQHFQSLVSTVADSKPCDNVKNPSSLKELCITKISLLPYGEYILNILGVRPLIKSPKTVEETPRSSERVAVPPEFQQPCDEQWLATPTKDDPSLLVCLSPSQSKTYKQEAPSPKEMQNLLDLHCKFLQRRGYHEKPPPPPPSRKYRPFSRESNVEQAADILVTSPRDDTKISTDVSRSRSTSRLLALLRAASEQDKVTPTCSTSLSNSPVPPPLPPPPDMLRANRPATICCNNTSQIFPEPPSWQGNPKQPPSSQKQVVINCDENLQRTDRKRERLRVRSLSDWLQLVRCVGGGNEDEGTLSKDSTPPILSTQSSPGAVRRTANHFEDQVRIKQEESGRRFSLPSKKEDKLPPLPSPKSQETNGSRRFDADNYRISKRGDIAIIQNHVGVREDNQQTSLRPRSLPPPSEALVTGGEFFRQQMYVEYMRKVAERSERRRQRVIRLSSVPRDDDMGAIDSAGGPLENEFMGRVKERMDKLGLRYDEDEELGSRQCGGELPKHLQEFLTLTDNTEDVNGVWSPSQKPSSNEEHAVTSKEKAGEGGEDAPPVVWAPKSAGASPTLERKEFRPIKFESPTLSRKNRSGTSTPARNNSEGGSSEVDGITTATTTATTTTTTTAEPSPSATTTTTFSSTFQPWQRQQHSRDDSTLTSYSSTSEHTVRSSSTLTSDRRLVQSQSAPASGLSALAAAPTSTKLPRAQNPTITLLQKAREGQLPRGALYLDHKMNSKEGENAYVSPNEILYSVKKEYESEGPNNQRKKIVELAPRKFEGIGPTTEEGIPIVLRSEIKDANQAKWYKRMYDSLHRAGKDDDYITIRYKTRKGQYPYTSPGGYLSEPEPACYDSDIGFSAKYATLDRRRIKNKENDFTTSTLPRSRYVPHPSSIKYASQVYKNQPGRIEDYEPGRSSISEKETKQWWDEVLDIFDGWLDSYSPHHPTYRSYSQLTTKADAMYQQRHWKERAYKGWIKSDDKTDRTQRYLPLQEDSSDDCWYGKSYSPEQQRREPKASTEPQTNESTPSNKSFMAHALKDGYESDSTLVFKRRDENVQSQISPAEQKQAYKTIQKGGEVPLHGLRKPAPERPKDISEIEYFPISAHLTRIRVHKQHVTPLREIMCYPVTASYNNNAVPPVFSTYKRTAPSYSQVQQARKPALPPPPPSPPRRLSSHHSSALRLWTGIRPPTQTTHVPRHRHEACFTKESSVSFLRDRLSHKLGVRSRTASSSPVSGRAKPSPVTGTQRSRSAPEDRFSTRKKAGTTDLKSQKYHQEGTAWLSQSPSLSSPLEVRKALQRQKDVKERPGSRSLPPGTIIRSSTTPYASVRNAAHLPEDKALRVTVAMSAKGRELLRSKAHTSLSSLRTSSKSATPSPEGNRSPSIGSPVPQTTGKTKAISSRSSPLSGSPGKKTTKTTSRECVLTESSRLAKTAKPVTAAMILLAEDAGNRRMQKSCGKKNVKEKTSVGGSKTGTSSKVCSKLLASKAKEEKETGKRKTKKTKPEGEIPQDAKRPSGSKSNGGSGVAKGKINGTEKKKGHVAEKKKMTTARVATDLNTSQQQSYGTEVGLSAQPGPLQTDSFFQQLLLRDISSPTPSITSSLCRSSAVLDKVQRFHELVAARSRTSHRADTSLGLLHVYLAQKKPVTESKFRSLDRELSRSPSPSYRSAVTRFSDFSSRHTTEDGAFYSFCPSRSRTPDVDTRHSLKIRSCSEPPPASSKGQAVVAKKEKPPVRCHSPASSSSPTRSPAYRRIRSAHCHSTKTIESIAGVKRKGPRAHSAGEAEEGRLKKEDQHLARSVSSLNIADHAEYQTYVMELVHSTKKSERFRELHNFYASLERLGQLEKTTSTGDLRPRLKGEEVIDYDRWKQLRTKERAEEELKVLYRKLKEAQKDRDLLFQPKDVESVRWRGDRGLRCKDKSVEDLKEQFGKLSREDADMDTKRKDLDIKKDVYKPLWRGSSVLNLVTSLSSTTASRRGRPVTAKEHHGVTRSLNRPPAGRYGRGIGCRLWSSLSMDQVNALKTQLNEIYSSVKGVKKGQEVYEITVPPAEDKVGTSRKKDNLHVRCNSLLTRDQLYSPMARRREARRIDSMKADSISSMPHWKKGSRDQDQAKPLSETEKKRLSLTLSQEVLDHVTKKYKSVSSPRETLGAIAAAAAVPKVKPKSSSPVLSETASPRTCYSLEMSEEDGGSMTSGRRTTRKNDFLLVLTPSNGSQSQQKEVEKVVEEWANAKPSTRRASDNGFTARPAVTTSTSETESASSDASTKTVIHRDEVHHKVEYFEGRTTRVSRSASDVRSPRQELTPTSRAKSAPGAIAILPATKLHSSQSFADLKDIFGEQNRLRYMSAPSRDRSESPTSSGQRTGRCYSSPDSGRSGSMSPDTGSRSWRTYLKMVKSGDVKRLKAKFESLEELCREHRRHHTGLRKHRSDPELSRQCHVVVRRQEVGDVRWLRRRYEMTCCRGRRKTRVSSPVLRHPIRLEDRFMPHINVISKTAALQQQSRSTTPISLPDDGYHTGEVERLRRKFEALPHLSLMGQMFTSTPDVRELRDIAPYLECHWVAHRFPDPGGGSTRSLSSPELRPAPPTPTRPRPSSSSPCTRSRHQQPLSILKQQQQEQAKDIFANQAFDPSKHRPLYRYQPLDMEWQRSRPTVTFKESPHRYVESEVTIHYRSPVRSEAKEALSEEELARRQAEAMRRIYQEERRRKYLQELQDMHSRRHTDNFTPSQKSPIPLNRYDDFFDDVANKSKSRDRTPEPKLVARALYNFVGQTSRELSFRRGDIIFVRRQIDKNWYEGEHNAMVGLFPFNYVEIIPYDGIRTIPKRPTEGQARAKFNFIAQTHLELSLVKGELVVLTRRVDDNWFEGRIGNRKGIFPVSYVEVLQEPGEKPVTSTAPPSKPASHITLMNGSGIKQSMGSHSYQPSFYYSHNKTNSSYTSTNPYATLPRHSQLSKPSLAPVNQTLHIDTHSEPVPYRALYNYRPQNEDELELCEGDTVYVMEKCDDGWYVGSSQRTGYFGTFPGNYVERI